VKTTVEADTVMLAIGQAADLSYVDGSIDITRGLVVIDKETQATNVSGIYAGGDMTTGPTSIIEAIAAGRRAANAIDSHLKGESRPKTSPLTSARKPLLQVNPEGLNEKKRVRMPETPLSQRSLELEDSLGLDWKSTTQEANRCLNCGCVAVNASDLAPALIALGAKIKTTRRTIDAEDFFDVGLLKSTLLDRNELVVELEIPAPPKGCRQRYWKYRIRNSLDFPICSVASIFVMDGDRIKDVRLVLGAVAPTPIRMREVEAEMIGKVAGDDLAEAANNFAFQGIIPLARNKFKIQMTRALLRKAIWSAAQ
jgi:CO/xanthine dehydrogenase FAD-binding subunit